MPEFVKEFIQPQNEDRLRPLYRETFSFIDAQVESRNEQETREEVLADLFTQCFIDHVLNVIHPSPFQFPANDEQFARALNTSTNPKALGIRSVRAHSDELELLKLPVHVELTSAPALAVHDRTYRVSKFYPTRLTSPISPTITFNQLERLHELKNQAKPPSAINTEETEGLQEKRMSDGENSDPENESPTNN